MKFSKNTFSNLCAILSGLALAAACNSKGDDDDSTVDAGPGENQPAEGEGQPAEGEGGPAEGESQPAEGEGEPAEGEGEGAVEACPVEIDLSLATLPCDCFGTVVEGPLADCVGITVCCPGIQAPKCEGEVPECPVDSSLTAELLPCSCFGRMVEQPLPDCPEATICCSVRQVPKCQ